MEFVPGRERAAPSTISAYRASPHKTAFPNGPWSISVLLGLRGGGYGADGRSSFAHQLKVGGWRAHKKVESFFREGSCAVA
jgi:hypothetical protein